MAGGNLTLTRHSLGRKGELSLRRRLQRTVDLSLGRARHRWPRDLTSGRGSPWLRVDLTLGRGFCGHQSQKRRIGMTLGGDCCDGG